MIAISALRYTTFPSGVGVPEGPFLAGTFSFRVGMGSKRRSS